MIYQQIRYLTPDKNLHCRNAVMLYGLVSSNQKVYERRRKSIYDHAAIYNTNVT